jgi:hypothetical protein
VNAGVGFQTDTVLEDSATGLAGLNLGVGGFLNENVALLFRISGTNVTYEDTFFELNQVSGVVGATVQFWPSDRFTLEAGGGAGFWNLGDESESGPGLVLGAGVVLLDHRRHKLHFGAEYAPAFPDAGTVHNLGLTIGYQYHR